MEEILSKIIEFVGAYEGSIVVAGGFVLELLLRLKKSEKPASILALVARIMAKVAYLLQRVSDLLSKLVPDKIKED